MRKGKIALGIAAAILVIGLIWHAYQAAPAPASPPVKPALNVSLVQPLQEQMTDTLTANGSVTAWQEAVIGAEVSDLHLAEVRVQVGDTVRKGQILAVFADEAVMADIANSRAFLAEAEANLAEARVNAERAQQVANSGALSHQQVHQYLTQEKTAQARMQAAKAQLDTQLLRLKYTRVVAADDGIISSRNATLGAVVSKGQELFKMIRQNRLEWRGEVSAAETAKLQIGLPVQVSVTGVGDITGNIRALPPSLDVQNRNGLVYVDLPDAAKHGLRAGMFARGVFKLGQRPALSVPQTAISLREGFAYVFKLVEQQGELGKVQQVKVELGRQQEDRQEIIAGINVEDRLVGAGATFLNDSDTVRVVQP